MTHQKRFFIDWSRSQKILSLLALVLSVAITSFVLWASQTANATPTERVLAQQNTAVQITETDHSIIIQPKTLAKQGLVFIPGAKVDPWAYAYKLTALASTAEITVVITKPILNLAFFDQRGLATFTNDAPAVHVWYVGGHSLGGVRACQYAAGGTAKGLILLGSYCANTVTIPTLSIAGGQDGLSTPTKIKDNRHYLPNTATLVEIGAANHASFGDYGVQAGDGTATIATGKMRMQLTDVVTAWLAKQNATTNN